jgi:hypothetical protein
MILTPQGPVRETLLNVETGGTIELTPGIYPTGGLHLKKKVGVTLKAHGPVTFLGGLRLSQCQEMRIEGIGFHLGKRHGLSIVDSQFIQLKRCQATQNQGHGILTIDTHEVLIEEAFIYQNGGHGVSFSQRGNELTVADCNIVFNKRCAVKCCTAQEEEKNWEPNGAWVRSGVNVRNNLLSSNGSPAVAMSGVTELQITGNTIRDHRGIYGVSLWDDGMNSPDYACSNVLIERNLVEFNPAFGKACIYIGKTNYDVSVGPSNIYQSRAGLTHVMRDEGKSYV